MSISTRRLRNAVAALAILAPLAAHSALAGDVEVTVRNVRTTGGHIMVALYADEAAYTAGKQTAGNMVPATSGQIRTLFVDVPEGRYAVAVYHDLDSDGQLARNLLNVPTEPFGFGNDAEVRFAQPGFDATAIAVSGPLTRAVVTLR